MTREVPLPVADPYTLFCGLGIGRGYILESMEGVPRRAVRSLIGLDPVSVFSIGEDQGHQDEHPAPCGDLPPGHGDAIDEIRSVLSCFRYPEGCGSGFTGGLVGYCSYDLVTSLTRGRVQAGRDQGPLARFMLSTRGIMVNHAEGSCLLFDNLLHSPGCDEEGMYQDACRRLEELGERIRAIGPASSPPRGTLPADPLPDPDPAGRAEFEAAVGIAREHILAGDIFQVVLSRKIKTPFQGDPLDVYGRIRVLNPSPYLYYLNFGDEAIVGSSPEMLVKVEGRAVQTVPIAGTRPRGRSPTEDLRLSEELLSDEKERAEHLMLVDLARNDIGRVAGFGSVSVPEFMDIEKFSHVQHIVSRVCGTLAEGRDRFDALASCFPAGTVSGAPKIRAMEIIADLEPCPRGLYAGAVGYCGFGDLLEFAIAIRTIRMRGGMAEFSTGAGIVADSIPGKEFDETGHKAQAMILALGGRGERR